MSHLTRAEIERKLLLGAAVSWLDSSGKKTQMLLGNASERRLFEFLLSSKVRVPTNLPAAFIDGLQAAYGASHDPAATLAAKNTQSTASGPWKLQAIETEGFGGINIWGGPPFRHEFACDSLLLEGPNGSGKSSFTGAILWALTGERPRDQAPAAAHEPKPVLGLEDRAVGQWPPLATYPPTTEQLKSDPQVRVQLLFRSPAGTARVERKLTAGKVSETIDPAFDVPSVLLETGLLMPARLAVMRLDEGRGRLTDAVQKLTGLDDLIEIATLTEGLCHKAREYRSYKKRELTVATREFDEAISESRQELDPVSVTVAKFAPTDTDDPKGAMADFGKMLAGKSQTLTEVISGDLAANLSLASLTIQAQVIAAIGAARADISAGLPALPLWKTLTTIAEAIDQAAVASMTRVIAQCRLAAVEAVALRDQGIADTKFQLKALATSWHVHYETGLIERCPLCDSHLEDKPRLVEQLESLRSAGTAAARTFEDNLTRIRSDLEAAVPAAVRNRGAEVLLWNPRALLIDNIRANFVARDQYSKTLVRFGALVQEALKDCPTSSAEFAPGRQYQGALQDLEDRTATIERLLELAVWFRTHSSEWLTWWSRLCDTAEKPGLNASSVIRNAESLSTHLTRLSDALEKAGPYRRGATAMRRAWTSGKEAAAIEKELARREVIANGLMPLKDLKGLCESIARRTIDELSTSIAGLLRQIHLTESLQFRDTRLDRKEGLRVYGGFVPDLRIDATLVANTSWLRAILWAFIFALRARALEQLGTDTLPLLVLDDPQATFDRHHQHRWAQYIASLQSGPSRAQLILSTYDETFLELIKVDGVTGREALLVSAGPELGFLGVLEGEALKRDWVEVQKLKTPRAARDFMSAARVYVEGMLKLMLRGENLLPNGSVMADCREKMRILNEVNGGVAPWNRTEFRKLVSHLAKNLPVIKHMEMAHHSTSTQLGIAEATDLHEHLTRNLLPALHTGFRLIRAHQLLHGGLKALHVSPSLVTLPEGYKHLVRALPLKLLGRAAALTDGQVADGRFDLDEFELTNHKGVILWQHVAFRLTAQTLEPVARPGDLLLVLDPSEPSDKSLVVACHQSRILARRFEVAENLTDVAVLTAHAINPRQIAPPVVAQRATLTMRKIVGVLYDEWASRSGTKLSEDEIVGCGSESAFSSLIADTLGLVEVLGRSAEPHALDHQYLIVRNAITGAEALRTLEGRPVIVGDTEGNRYFKRLRANTGDRVVLESLDSGGEYGPIVLSLPGGSGNCVERAWPVAGVLFELPK
jgi:hypothetical protein